MAGDLRPRPHLAAAGGFTPQANHLSPLSGVRQLGALGTGAHAPSESSVTPFRGSPVGRPWNWGSRPRLIICHPFQGFASWAPLELGLAPKAIHLSRLRRSGGCQPIRPRMSSRVSEANRGICGMPSLRQLISPKIPRVGACGTSLGMTSKKDASLGMSVGTIRLAKSLSRKGGIYPALAPVPLCHSDRTSEVSKWRQYEGASPILIRCV